MHHDRDSSPQTAIRHFVDHGMDFDGLHYPCAEDRWLENERSELADIRLTEQFKDFTITERARWGGSRKHAG